MSEEARSMGALFARLNEANALHQSGNIPAAVPAYRAILNDWPDQPDALHMLGIIAQQMGQYALALQLFDETLRIVPHFGTAWVNRATLLRLLDRFEDALQSTQKAIEAEPKLGGGWNMSGVLLRDLKRYDEALLHHKKAVELNPEDPSFLYNYACILLTLGQIEDAWRTAKKAEILAPNRAEILATLGVILISAGWPSRAVPYLRKAQELEPRYIDAAVNEANAHLFMGDFKTALPLMEKRKLYLHDNQCLNLPRWDGNYVEHLLIAAEQGAGDNIQSLRYVPHLKGRVGTITLQMPKALMRLAHNNFPDLSIIEAGDALPKADAFIPIMSLTHYCAPQDQTIPALLPLKTDDGLRRQWRNRLSHLPRPRIGFVWAGNPIQGNDHNRSIPWQMIKPLVQAAGQHAVCLQKGGADYDLTGLTCFDASQELGDFADGAALMAELDLLITVDTAPAHIMGSLEKPVWVMLPFDPGWRYMLGREDSVWYPTMRLFRQRQWGDWSGVIADVSKAMDKYRMGDSSVLQPKAGKPTSQNPNAIALAD